MKTFEKVYEENDWKVLYGKQVNSLVFIKREEEEGPIEKIKTLSLRDFSNNPKEEEINEIIKEVIRRMDNEV